MNKIKSKESPNRVFPTISFFSIHGSFLPGRKLMNERGSLTSSATQVVQGHVYSLKIRVLASRTEVHKTHNLYPMAIISGELCELHEILGSENPGED
jgi:hypothetical protein